MDINNRTGKKARKFGTFETALEEVELVTIFLLKVNNTDSKKECIDTFCPVAGGAKM